MRRFSAETHLEIRTLKEHLEALAAREMFRMALRDKGLKTYDFWLRHAPPRPAHVPPPEDPQQEFCLDQASYHCVLGTKYWLIASPTGRATGNADLRLISS